MMTINYRFIAVRSNRAPGTKEKKKILRKDLGVKVFKVQLVQDERPTNAEFLVNGELAEDPILYRSATKLIFGSMGMGLRYVQ